MSKKPKNSGYYVATSSDGVRICVGTFIHFIFYSSTPFGDIEDDIQGRIIEVKGHLCFRYKDENGFHTKRLSTLRYDAESDWYYNREFSYHTNKWTPIPILVE